MFGGDALSLAFYKPGNIAGAQLMEVGNLGRKTLGEKRAYNRRVAGNASLGQPTLLAQVMLKLPQNSLAGDRRR